MSRRRLRTSSPAISGDDGRCMGVSWLTWDFKLSPRSFKISSCFKYASLCFYTHLWWLAASVLIDCMCISAKPTVALISAAALLVRSDPLWGLPGVLEIHRASAAPPLQDLWYLLSSEPPAAGEERSATSFFSDSTKLQLLLSFFPPSFLSHLGSLWSEEPSSCFADSLRISCNTWHIFFFFVTNADVWESREVLANSGTLPQSSVLGSLQGLWTASSRLGRKAPTIFPRWPSVSKQSDLFCQLPRSAFLLLQPSICFVWPSIAPDFDLCKCTHKKKCGVQSGLDLCQCFPASFI